MSNTDTQIIAPSIQRSKFGPSSTQCFPLCVYYVVSNKKPFGHKLSEGLTQEVLTVKEAFSDQVTPRDSLTDLREMRDFTPSYGGGSRRLLARGKPVCGRAVTSVGGLVRVVGALMGSSICLPW